MELILLILGITILVMDFSGLKNKRMLGYVALIGLAFDALWGIFTLYGKNIILAPLAGEVFKGSLYVLDPLALFFKELFCMILFLVILISINYFVDKSPMGGEFISLVLFAGLGMMMMASAGDFLLLFVSMELISIPLYILAAFNKKSRESAEAGIKYFILGAMASAFFLYGVSILFGNSGSLVFLSNGQENLSPLLSGSQLISLETFSSAFSSFFMLGLVMIIAGLGFKIAAAPFHMWAPDVYEGAPFPIAAFISVGPKIAGIALILRFFLSGLPSLMAYWAPLISIIAIMSIVIGNLSALKQDNIKRLLAYSGISQMGYVLLGLIGASGKADQAVTAVLFYCALYAVTNLGAFAVAMLCAEHYRSESIKDFKGLHRKSPALAFIMAILLLSLAGVPPLAGFFGKFYLFLSAYNAFDHKLAGFVALAILFSVISLFYYLRILNYMFFSDPEGLEPLLIPGTYKLALSVFTLTPLLLGYIPVFYDLMHYLSSFI